MFMVFNYYNISEEINVFPTKEEAEEFANKHNAEREPFDQLMIKEITK